MFNTNLFIYSDTTMSKTQQKFDNEAKVNTANSITRIRSDYAQPWVGLLRETIQNSTDGWGFNKQQNNLPQDKDLTIEFFIDTDAQELRIQDNAGGMNYETFSDNLLAIDNPSLDKADGNGAGSYGRGFWVIMSCGEEAELETYHESGMYSSAVNNKGRYRTIEEVTEPIIGSGEKGTFYHIKNVREDDMFYLSDWDKIEDVIVENFAPLLNDDSVTIEYTIDAEKHTPTAPDLNNLRSEYALCEKDELEPFTYHDEEFRVKNFVMIDATKMDEEPPWKGITLFKGNEYLDYPFMKVDSYKSQVVPSMRRNPPKMFGWCDASDICRTRNNGETLENNAHDNIQLNRVGNKTNLQDEVYRLHDEHFKNNYTTQEKDELLSTIQNNMNSIMDKFENFSELSKMGGVGTGPSKSGDTPSMSLSFLRCKTDKVKLDEDEDISLGVELNPRDELEYDTYNVFDIQVKNITEDEVVHQIDPVTFELEPNTPVEQLVDVISIEDEGKYVFSASVTGHDETDVKDTSKITFEVGNVEKEDKPDGGEKDSEGSVSFIREINNFAGSDEESGRALVSEHPEGGLTLHVNTEWPTLLKLQKEERADEFEQAQQKMFIEWGLDAVVDYWLEDSIQDAETKDEQVEIVRESVKIRENLSKEWVLSE